MRTRNTPSKSRGACLHNDTSFTLTNSGNISYTSAPSEPAFLLEDSERDGTYKVRIFHADRAGNRLAAKLCLATFEVTIDPDFDDGCNPLIEPLYSLLERLGSSIYLEGGEFDEEEG